MKRLLLGVPGLVASILVGQFTSWGDVSAWHGTNNPNPDMGWKWKDAKLIGGAVADDHTAISSVYEQPIIDLIDDWRNKTDLAPTRGLVANHASNRIHYWDVNVGPNGYLGKATTYSIEGYSSLQLCVPGTSTPCNKTNHRATYADINLNIYRLGPGKDFGTDFNRRHTIGHELGHPFSLTHPTDCVFGPVPVLEEAIMRQTACPPVFDNVRGHDEKDAAILYP